MSGSGLVPLIEGTTAQAMGCLILLQLPLGQDPIKPLHCLWLRDTWA